METNETKQNRFHTFTSFSNQKQNVYITKKKRLYNNQKAYPTDKLNNYAMELLF